MFLLPTKGRPENLRRFLNAAREMGGTSLPGWILVNEDEWAERKEEYERILVVAPAGWIFKPVKAKTYGGAIRAVWKDIKDLPWVGLVSDDLVPHTSGWDVQLVNAVQGWNVVSANDGRQAPARMHGATVWSGPIMRAVGWIFPEGLHYVFHDDVWETLGRETGCWQTRMDILTKHMHEFYETGVRGPTMDPTSDIWQHDEHRFIEWRDGGEREACVARIKAVMASHGVRTVAPDFTGVRLMIATPSHDGKYESSYLVSLYQSFEMLKQQGVVCELAEEKYTADIALARNKIFSTFYHSKSTHLLMIDADMGWTPEALTRLFWAKKDFVAIAGPKKRYPLSFAVSYTDEHRNPLELVFDQESGTIEVSEVGAAFTLITRSCAEQMVAAYPELKHTGVSEGPEWGVFIPLVSNDRFYSEDFAFCKRWRDIGGKLHVVPDVSLKHTGFHTFEGKFSALMVPPEQVQEAAE